MAELQDEGVNGIIPKPRYDRAEEAIFGVFMVKQTARAGPSASSNWPQEGIAASQVFLSLLNFRIKRDENVKT